MSSKWVRSLQASCSSPSRPTRLTTKKYPKMSSLVKYPSNSGVTAVILTVSFKGSEFFRLGYYVYNQYGTQNMADNPPEVVDISQITRSILSDKPRITRFEIPWADKDKT